MTTENRPTAVEAREQALEEIGEFDGEWMVEWIDRVAVERAIERAQEAACLALLLRIQDEYHDVCKVGDMLADELPAAHARLDALAEEKR